MSPELLPFPAAKKTKQKNNVGFGLSDVALPKSAPEGLDFTLYYSGYGTIIVNCKHFNTSAT